MRSFVGTVSHWFSMSTKPNEAKSKVNESSVQVCKKCSAPLIKQYLDGKNQPLPKFDPNGVANFTFGKHNGKAFSEVSKRTIRAYIERYQRGATVIVKYPQLYCQLHRFAEQTFPEWAETLALLCKCRQRCKMWSCPEHGFL